MSNMQKKKYNNVPLLVISPTGRFYPISSLEQCAMFFAQLSERLTGNKPYFDYKLIRHRIEFDNGEFAGPLAGWKIVEFPDFDTLRNYLWDLDGIPQLQNNGIREEEYNRIIVEEYNSIRNRSDDRSNNRSDSRSDNQGNSALDEFNKVFNS